jgi:hypothetical protein
MYIFQRQMIKNEHIRSSLLPLVPCLLGARKPGRDEEDEEVVYLRARDTWHETEGRDIFV